MSKAGLDRPLTHILLIILLSLLAYSNTFHVPFHYDDFPAIVENPVIKDLHHFIRPSGAKVFKGHFEYDIFRSRYFAYLTFALNYRIHGLDVTGFHIFNLLVHTCSGLLIYFLVTLSFRTPFLSGAPLRKYSGHIALFTALFFVCHPLQTEAVTYIWQRVASLAAMLYLLSIVAYVRWRLGATDEDAPRRTRLKLKVHPLFYVVSVIAAVLAMKTKQTAFTLPVAIAVYEFMFMKGKTGRRVLYLVPLFLTMLLVPLALVDVTGSFGDILSGISESTRDRSDVPRLHYLFTELRVMMTYLRLVLAPVGQNLDYDYPIYRSFLDPAVLLSFVFLSAVFGLGVYLCFRRPASHTRLISFGILWFFITLSVESSLIPILSVINEYRMYLPSAGVFLAAVTAIFAGVEKSGKTPDRAFKTVIAGLMIIVLLLAGAAYKRNMVWQDSISLWENVVKNSPGKPRGHISLGNAYKSQGLIDRAIEQYEISVSLDPYSAKAHNNLGNAYKSQGLIDRAIEHYSLAIEIDPAYFVAHNNLGNAYRSLGQIEKAVWHYRTAIGLNPYYPETHNNIGNAYRSLGQIEKAVWHYRTAIGLDAYYSAPHVNLGNVYMAKNMADKAIEHYLIAEAIDPARPEIHYNLGVAYRSVGRTGEAEEHFRKAETLLKAGQKSP